MKRRFTGITCIGDYVLCVLIIVTLNLALFYSGLYRYICRPDSYSGNVYSRMMLLKQIEEKTNDRPLVIMGDSSADEGIGGEQLSAITGKPVVNIALPATGPLVWFHYFRSIDPERKRFDTIVLLVAPHEVETSPHNEGIQSLMAVSTPHILWDYFGTFPDPWKNLDHFYGSVDRLYAFRRDLRHLFFNPSRILNSGTLREENQLKMQGLLGEKRDVCNVGFNRETYQITEWGSIDNQGVRRIASRTLIQTQELNKMPRVTGILEPLKKIIRYYQGSRSKILLVTIPLGWDHHVDPNHPVHREYFYRLSLIAASSAIAHWDATALPLFQRCENYYDFRHLNIHGRKEFTEQLGKVLKHAF